MYFKLCQTKINLSQLFKVTFHSLISIFLLLFLFEFNSVNSNSNFQNDQNIIQKYSDLLIPTNNEASPYLRFRKDLIENRKYFLN